MSFAQAVRSVLAGLTRFDGRARRAEYWWWVLATLPFAAVLDALGRLWHTPAVGGVTGMALLVLGVAVSVRRLHDTDRTGWWLLISLVPVAGGLVLLVFSLLDGSPGPNRFGPSPKTPAAREYHLQY